VFEELLKIILRASKFMKIETDNLGGLEIAKRSRGTPRIANRLLRRVADFAVVEGTGIITKDIADSSLTRIGVDLAGLDSADRKYLKIIAENYAGGPVGVETISAAMSEARDALEEVIEPYLLQQGFIQRTPQITLAQTLKQFALKLLMHHLFSQPQLLPQVNLQNTQVLNNPP
jgi:Holliday junction DNA helicase RuvB